MDGLALFARVWKQEQSEAINHTGGQVIGQDISSIEDCSKKCIIPLLKYDIKKIVPSINHGESMLGMALPAVNLLLIDLSTAH